MALGSVSRTPQLLDDGMKYIGRNEGKSSASMALGNRRPNKREIYRHHLKFASHFHQTSTMQKKTTRNVLTFQAGKQVYLVARDGIVRKVRQKWKKGGCWKHPEIFVWKSVFLIHGVRLPCVKEGLYSRSNILRLSRVLSDEHSRFQAQNANIRQRWILVFSPRISSNRDGSSVCYEIWRLFFSAIPEDIFSCRICTVWSIGQLGTTRITLRGTLISFI